MIPYPPLIGLFILPKGLLPSIACSRLEKSQIRSSLRVWYISWIVKTFLKFRYWKLSLKRIRSKLESVVKSSQRHWWSLASLLVLKERFHSSGAGRHGSGTNPASAYCSVNFPEYILRRITLPREYSPTADRHISSAPQGHSRARPLAPQAISRSGDNPFCRRVWQKPGRYQARCPSIGLWFEGIFGNWQRTLLNARRIKKLLFTRRNPCIRSGPTACMNIISLSYYDTTLKNWSWVQSQYPGIMIDDNELPLKSEETTSSSVYPRIPFIGPSEPDFIAWLIIVWRWLWKPCGGQQPRHWRWEPASPFRWVSPGPRDAQTDCFCSTRWAGMMFEIRHALLGNLRGPSTVGWVAVTAWIVM